MGWGEVGGPRDDGLGIRWRDCRPDVISVSVRGNYCSQQFDVFVDVSSEIFYATFVIFFYCFVYRHLLTAYFGMSSVIVFYCISVKPQCTEVSDIYKNPNAIVRKVARDIYTH